MICLACHRQIQWSIRGCRAAILSNYPGERWEKDWDRCWWNWGCRITCLDSLIQPNPIFLPASLFVSQWWQQILKISAQCITECCVCCLSIFNTFYQRIFVVSCCCICKLERVFLYNITSLNMSLFNSDIFKQQ